MSAIKSNKTLKTNPKSLHLKLAYNLGRTARKVSDTLNVKKKSARKKLKLEQEPLSPILKEIKAIADVSGLTAVIEQMNEISLKHAKHPVLKGLISKVERLSPMEKEMLSMKFIENLKTNPYLNNSLPAFSGQGKITEEQCQDISNAMIKSIFDTMEEIGITPRERGFLKKYSDELTKPFNDLVQLYLNPKTFGQKVKRLWRIQRILVKMIKLINMTNTLDKLKSNPSMKEMQFLNLTKL